MIKYVLQSTSLSSCNHCDKHLKLLIEAEIDEVSYVDPMDRPTFFICFNCNRVFQAGVGELKLPPTFKEWGE